MRRSLALALGAAVLAACGGGAGPSATLGVIETSADVRAGETAEYVIGEDGDALAVGDEVRTDRTGFAQITYPDGSLTRLDRETTFRVVALGDAPEAADVEATLEAGRVWNRVKDLGTDGRFSVDTATGTAAVRGTAFDVDCAFGCVFRVLEGQVEVTAGDGGAAVVNAGQGVQVGADGALGPVLALVGLDDDPWLARNLGLDEGAGFGGVGPLVGPDLATAGIGGTWDVRFTSTEGSTDPDAPPGSASDVTFTIAPSCPSGPCDGTIDGGPAGTFDVVLVDGVHTIDDTEQTTTVECQPRPVFDRRVTGTLFISAVLGDTPDRAALFVGTVREEFTPLPDAVADGCAEDGVRIRDSVVRGVLRP